MAVDADRVKAAAHFRQHIGLMNQRRMNAKRQSAFIGPFANRQQLDDVSQFPGKLNINRRKPVDSLDVQIFFANAGVEREPGENRQLLCRIATGYIQRWISFLHGISQFLCLLQSFLLI